MSSLFLSSNFTNDKTDNNANNDFFSKSMNQSENLSSKYEKYKNQLLNTSPQSMLFSSNNDSTSTIAELKKLYDERIISLYNNIRVTTLQLQTDDLLSTMRNDISTSQNSEFILSRTKEIIDGEFYSEKEKTISKLIEENAALRGALSDTMRDKNTYNDEYINKLKEMNIAQDIKIKQNEKTISEQNEHINELLNENSEIGKQSQNEIERLNKVINVIEIDLATAEQSQREQSETIASLTKQLNDSALLIRKHVEEGKSKQKLIEQYEKERMDIMSKYGMIEKNLGDEKEKNEVIKEKYSSMYNEMQNGMKSLSQEWERRNKKMQSEYEKIINEIERKNKNEIESLKKKHEIENMRNINEIKDLKIKNEQFRELTTKYIKIDEHERIIRDKIKEEKEKMKNEITTQSALIESEYKSKLKLLSDEKRKEINDINLNYKSKIELIENENANLKKMINDLNAEKESAIDNIKRTQMIIEDKEKEIQNLNEKSEIVTERENRTISENSILKTEIISLKDEIGNQNDKISSLLQQYKLCEENLNKYKNDKNSQKEIILQNENKIESLEKKLNEFKLEISDKEKEVLNLEKKVKEQQKFYNSLIEENFEKNEKIKNFVASTIKMLKYQIKSLDDYTKNEIESIKKETENKMKLFISKIANILSIYAKEKKQNEKLFEDTKSNYTTQISTLQSILNTALNSMNESKNEFLSEINSIKSECEQLNKCHSEEIASKEKIFESQLSKIENELREAQFENEKMKRDIKNKVSSLNQKEEQIKTLTNKLMEQTEQIFQYKKETEQIISSKDNKISQLQNVVNQSLHSLNKGVNSVQIANQLDSEVKELIRTAKINSLYDRLSEIKIPSINSK